MVVRVCQDGKVWTATEAQELREMHRIVCGTGGICRFNCNKASEHRLPLQLTPEQLHVGRVHGFLEQAEKEVAVEAPAATASWWSVAWQAVTSLFSTNEPQTRLESEPTTEPTLSNVPLRYRVFEDLWSQGFFITSGSKFGGDLLIYNSDPRTAHATAIIFILPSSTLSPQDLVAYGRLARAVKKNCTLAYINQAGDLRYTTLTHASTTSRAGRPRVPRG
ncbi:hypothetical protein ACHHYP_09441 [Achlya hypogyna]|uniref:tRNA-intron lyase n=1 Tax=Achlya hypogyna TaxID=1202772 RepID=A0A1V9ZIZ4_ACHHY|nr:hypothetical protein ACHHYP_09441 [Achlya hypogyna]